MDAILIHSDRLISPPLLSDQSMENLANYRAKELKQHLNGLPCVTSLPSKFLLRPLLHLKHPQ